MAQKLSNLPIGAKIKDKGSAYYGKDIVWMKLADNHYGMNETTLLSEQIISLKASDAKEPNNSNRDRKSYGNNRYIHSNIKQWLNSSTSSWYKSQHSADEPPKGSGVSYNPYDTEKGFMANLTAELRSAILPTSLKVIKNPVDGGEVESFTDKIFLLSCTEVGLDNDTSYNEGTKFDYFKSNSDRVAYPTKEAIDNNTHTSDNLSTSKGYYWWLRTPYSSSSNPGDVCSVGSDGSLSGSSACYDGVGVRPALNLDSGILVSDKPDENGVYQLFRDYNSSPTISGTDTNLGEKNQPFEISYKVEDKDITDNVTVTEHLNNRQIRRITNANNTDQTLKITSELLNSCPLGETNTIKIYAEDEKGAGTYRNYWFKRTNTPPYFVEENKDLGTIKKAPTIEFTAKDDDGDKYLKAKVKINQRVVKVYDQLGNGEKTTFTLGWKDFMQLHHSRKHNLWVEIEDSSGALATLKYTFEREVNSIEIVTNTAPLDIKIKLMVFNANIKLGEGATFLQYACNDFGTGNTWEKIENGVPHEFANKHEGKDVIGYKCELTKGTGESEIRSIGGSFI